MFFNSHNEICFLDYPLNLTSTFSLAEELLTFHCCVRRNSEAGDVVGCWQWPNDGRREIPFSSHLTNRPNTIPSFVLLRQITWWCSRSHTLFVSIMPCWNIRRLPNLLTLTAFENWYLSWWPAEALNAWCLWWRSRCFIFVCMPFSRLTHLVI